MTYRTKKAEYIFINIYKKRRLTDSLFALNEVFTQNGGTMCCPLSPLSAAIYNNFTNCLPLEGDNQFIH